MRTITITEVNGGFTVLYAGAIKKATEPYIYTDDAVVRMLQDAGEALTDKKFKVVEQ